MTTVDLLTIEEGSDSSFANEVVVSLGASESTQAVRPSGAVPPAIPADQAYYWSAVWQADIRESIAALEAGDFADFDSDDPNDIVRWFLSGD